jgi:hypothetical protein
MVTGLSVIVVTFINSITTRRVKESVGIFRDLPVK